MSEAGEGRMAASGEIAQLNLWEVSSRVRSNMVALYDLAPRFSFGKSGDGKNRKDILERDFSFGGAGYRITLKPTRMKENDGRQVDKLLAEREQIVEEVIRRLACSRGRLSLYETVVARGRAGSRNQFNVRFAFSLHEVRQELSRVSTRLASKKSSNPSFCSTKFESPSKTSTQKVDLPTVSWTGSGWKVPVQDWV